MSLDGFFRGACVRKLVEIDSPVVVPFVIKLLGEYVIQIIDVITVALPRFNKETYGQFVRANPQFLAIT